MSVLSDALHGFYEVRPMIGGGLCILGGALSIIGSIGVLRFPDFYTRLHAASVTDTGAVLALLIGMAFLSPHWLVLIKLLAVAVFLFLTAPTASHAIANAAHTADVEPVIGRLQKDQDGEDVT